MIPFSFVRQLTSAFVTLLGYPRTMSEELRGRLRRGRLLG